MAYDKVVDSAQLDGALTATADAIREKTGSAEKIMWNAGTGFAAAIAAIATGGGESGGIYVESGTYIPTTDTTTFDVIVSKDAHDNCIFYMLSADADAIAALDNRLNAVSDTSVVCSPAHIIGTYKNCVAHAITIKYLTETAQNYGIAYNGNNYLGGISEIDDTVICFGSGYAVRSFRAGVPYNWSVYYTKEADA